MKQKEQNGVSAETVGPKESVIGGQACTAPSVSHQQDVKDIGYVRNVIWFIEK